MRALCGNIIPAPRRFISCFVVFDDGVTTAPRRLRTSRHVPHRTPLFRHCNPKMRIRSPVTKILGLPRKAIGVMIRPQRYFSRNTDDDDTPRVNAPTGGWMRRKNKVVHIFALRRSHGAGGCDNFITPGKSIVGREIAWTFVSCMHATTNRSARALCCCVRLSSGLRNTL